MQSITIKLHSYQYCCLTLKENAVYFHLVALFFTGKLLVLHIFDKVFY